jgi:hypothetical protein
VLLSLAVLFFIVGLLIEAPTSEFIREKNVEIISGGGDEAGKFMDDEEVVNSSPEANNTSELDRSKWVGDKYHDRGKLPDEFEKIEVGLRIMPS